MSTTIHIPKYIRTFESQGSNFVQGVRFSVQTISLGNDEYRNVRESLYTEDVTPRRLNDTLGDAVFSALMKFNEAQNCPDRTFVKPRHSLSILKIQKYGNSTECPKNIGQFWNV